MGKLLTTSVILTVTLITHAQKFTILPQIGVQYVKSNLEYGTGSFMGLNTSFRHFNTYAGVRLMYEGKRGHGPFAGIAMGKSGSNYKFFYPGAPGDYGLYNMYRASTMADVLRLELGYHWSSKPIYFNKILDSHRNPADFDNQKKKGWSVRIQPLIGLAWQKLGSEWSGTDFMYPVREDLLPGQSRSNFAVVTGLNFEFGKNNKRKFTLSFNYVRASGVSLTRTKITIDTPVDHLTGVIGSNGTSFNVSIGIPLSFGRKRI